jgi:hypothetical protein
MTDELTDEERRSAATELTGSTLKAVIDAVCSSGWSATAVDERVRRHRTKAAPVQMQEAAHPGAHRERAEAMILHALIRRRAIPRALLKSWSWMPAANSPHGIPMSESRPLVLMANRARALLAHTLLRGAGL